MEAILTRCYNRTLRSLVRIKEGVLGVIVYGSRHPISKRNGDIGVGRSEKGDKQVECTSLGTGRWSRGQALGTWRY